MAKIVRILFSDDGDQYLAAAIGHALPNLFPVDEVPLNMDPTVMANSSYLAPGVAPTWEPRFTLDLAGEPFYVFTYHSSILLNTAYDYSPDLYIEDTYDLSDYANNICFWLLPLLNAEGVVLPEVISVTEI
jgi:hypothetical protein